MDGGASELGSCSMEWKSMTGGVWKREMWGGGSEFFLREWDIYLSIYIDKVQISRFKSRFRSLKAEYSESLSGYQKAKGGKRE